MFGAALAVAGTLGAVGAAMGYLQPYHWRIVAPIVVVAPACMLALALEPTRPRAVWKGSGFVAFLILLAGLTSEGPPLVGPSDLDRNAALAGIVSARGDGGWVEFGTVGKRMWGSPVAVRLEERLRRGPPLAAERGAVHLVLAGPPEALAEVEATTVDAPGVSVVTTLPGGPESVLLVVRLADARSSSAWTARACAASPDGLRIERRAIDYLKFERADLKEPFISMWWHGCTGGNVGWGGPRRPGAAARPVNTG